MKGESAGPDSNGGCVVSADYCGEDSTTDHERGMTMRWSMRSITALLAALPMSRTEAQQSAGDSAFVRAEAMIPARDGIRLFTVIVAAKRGTAPLPILMTRTPYGARGAPGVEGYIRVVQDIRGRYGSGGEVDIKRAPHSGPPRPQRGNA